MTRIDSWVGVGGDHLVVSLEGGKDQYVLAIGNFSEADRTRLALVGLARLIETRRDFPSGHVKHLLDRLSQGDLP